MRSFARWLLAEAVGFLMPRHTPAPAVARSPKPAATVAPRSPQADALRLATLLDEDRRLSKLSPSFAMSAALRRSQIHSEIEALQRTGLRVVKL